MSKWKCEICGKEFENFHAQGFNHKIYCPLCFFKEDNRILKEVIEEVREYLEFIKYDKTDKYIPISQYDEYKHLLQILDKAKEI